jgi:hypothetical protein
MKITNTEALAEIKTIENRIEKKSEFIETYACHSANLVDPLAKKGGSDKLIAEALQSIKDLQERLLALRAAIRSNNETTVIEVQGKKRTIADWLSWRRDVFAQQEASLKLLAKRITTVRQNIAGKSGSALARGSNQQVVDVGPDSMTVYVDEKWLSDEIEMIGRINDELDGQLSLKNATTFVEIPD